MTHKNFIEWKSPLKPIDRQKLINYLDERISTLERIQKDMTSEAEVNKIEFAIRELLKIMNHLNIFGPD